MASFNNSVSNIIRRCFIYRPIFLNTNFPILNYGNGSMLKNFSKKHFFNNNLLNLHTNRIQFMSSSPVNKTQKQFYDIIFTKTDGTEINVSAKEGDTLLDVIRNQNIDFDGFGACDGTMSCSTCHVIFSTEDFDQIENPLSDEELDILDRASCLTDTSRLGCQVCVSKKMNGAKIIVPPETADARI